MTTTRPKRNMTAPHSRSKETLMADKNINWDQLIETKLDELEKIKPSKDDYLDRKTRRESLETLLESCRTDEEKLQTIRNTSLLELFQASMF